MYFFCFFFFFANFGSTFFKAAIFFKISNKKKEIHWTNSTIFPDDRYLDSEVHLLILQNFKLYVFLYSVLRNFVNYCLSYYSYGFHYINKFKIYTFAFSISTGKVL